MKEKLVFATNNAHKLEEVSTMLGERIELLSLRDIGCHADIPETGTTLEENALLKARYVNEHFNTDCFADDTGLEVEALGGEPGVYSARYAGGEGHDSVANMNKLLARLKGVENRRARFRTVIALDFIFHIAHGQGRKHRFVGRQRRNEFDFQSGFPRPECVIGRKRGDGNSRLFVQNGIAHGNHIISSFPPTVSSSTNR